MASFMITDNHIENGEFVGRMFGDEEYLKAGKAKHHFKLFDDDGVLYLEGVSGNSSSFEPLDWAMAMYGCTEIQYKNNDTGKWETL